MIFINKINTIILQVVKKKLHSRGIYDHGTVDGSRALSVSHTFFSVYLGYFRKIERKTKIHKYPAIPPAAHTF